jgi:adenine-specific DNA-methyltransferase
MNSNKIDLTLLAQKKTFDYEQLHPYENLKEKGQVFTPVLIAKFMANQFDLSYSQYNILDPGAGTGILTAAICNRIAKEFNEKKIINITAYEDDKSVLPYLNQNMQEIKEQIEEIGHKFNYKIINKNFIYDNYLILDSINLFNCTSKKFNIIISNPPYFKVSKSDRLSQLMAEIVHGQPNIYMFFFAISSRLLSDDGQMVFITPRSFCSGLYFKKFREWLLNIVNLSSIHIFKSRNETFSNKVLQETIITKFVKKNDKDTISISESNKSDIMSSISFEAPKDAVINPNDRDKIICIPKNNEELELVRTMRCMRNTFKDLGYKISTGPVVSFRNKENLTYTASFDPDNAIPLIWMNNLKDYSVVFPLKDLKKPQYLKLCGKTEKLILPNKNYVLVKRFSSKEQKKRVYASCYFYEIYDFPYVTFENHLNYIKSAKGYFSKKEVLGIMAYLNSTFVDNYFRTINGNTQVNAKEIESLPFPELNEIEAIGEHLEVLNNSLNQKIIDKIISEILHLKIILRSHDGKD